jgi:hypothetical protein
MISFTVNRRRFTFAPGQAEGFGRNGSELATRVASRRRTDAKTCPLDSKTYKRQASVDDRPCSHTDLPGRVLSRLLCLLLLSGRGKADHAAGD